MRPYYIHVTGLMTYTTTDTVCNFFDNKKRSGVGGVYFVNRLNKTECEVFFMTDEVTADLKEKSFRIDQTDVKICDIGTVFNHRLSVEKINCLTTKDGLKLFFKAHTGKDVHIIEFEKSNGKATLEFEHSPDLTAVALVCKDNALDDNHLEIKPLKVSNTIVVTGYNQKYYDDLINYFDNTKRSGGDDVVDVEKIDDETHLVTFLYSYCVIDVCKRKHTLKGKELKVDVYYQRVDSGDENNMFPRCDRFPFDEPVNQGYANDDSLTTPNCLPCDGSLTAMETKSKLAFKDFESGTLIAKASNGVVDVCKRKHTLKGKELKEDVYYQRVDSGDENNMFTRCDRFPFDEPVNQGYAKDDSLTTPNCLPCDGSLTAMETKSKPTLKDFESGTLIAMASNAIECPSLSQEVTPLSNENPVFNCEFEGPKELDKFDLESKEYLIDQHDNEEIEWDSQLSEITFHSNEDPLFVCKVEKPKEFDNFDLESKEHLSDQHDNGGTNSSSLASNTTKHSNKVPLSVHQVVVTKHTDTLKWIKRNNVVYQHDMKGAQTPIFLENTGAREIGITRHVKSRSKAKSIILEYIHVCQTLAVAAVQQYFARIVPEIKLKSHLKSHMKNLKFRSWKCTSDQYAVLFPEYPDSVRSTNFDFPLLYKLIRFTFTSLPTQGWGFLPLPENITEEDDIERIKHFMTHKNISSLTDSDFINFWTDLSQAIIRLSCETLSTDITNLSNQMLDQQSKNENLKHNPKDNFAMTNEMRTFHQDTFNKEDTGKSMRQTGEIYNPSNVIDRTDSDFHTYHLPFLKKYQEFDVPSGQINREIRDCTAMPGVGWIFSDYNNSELIKIDRKHGVSIYTKLSKPMFVSCVAGDVAVSVENGSKITVFDKNTWTVKKEIPTKDSVLGIANIRKRLLFRAANIGCRFVASNKADTLIPIKGDSMTYIAVWKDLIFLTSWKTDAIFCYNTSGEKQWTFSNERLRCPNGVATDKEGNIFIVGTYSNNILIVSKNYKETGEYRFQNANMKYPIAIDYDKSSCKFIVCNLKGKVKIFDVVATGKYTNG